MGAEAYSSGLNCTVEKPRIEIDTQSGPICFYQLKKLLQEFWGLALDPNQDSNPDTRVPQNPDSQRLLLLQLSVFLKKPILEKLFQLFGASAHKFLDLMSNSIATSISSKIIDPSANQALAVEAVSCLKTAPTKPDGCEQIAKILAINNLKPTIKRCLVSYQMEFIRRPVTSPELNRSQLEFLVDLLLQQQAQVSANDHKLDLNKIIYILTPSYGLEVSKALVWSSYCKLWTLGSIENKPQPQALDCQKTLEESTFSWVGKFGLVEFNGGKHTVINLPNFKGDSAKTDFLNFLDNSGLKQYLTERARDKINSGELDSKQPIKIFLTAFDGSFDSKDPELEGLSWNLPEVTWIAGSDNQPIEIELIAKNYNHHPTADPHKRMEMDSSSLQILKANETLLRTKPPTNSLTIAFSQPTQAIDTDMSLCIILERMATEEPGFYRENQEVIEILANVINPIDQTGGSPNLNLGTDNPEANFKKVSEYLNFPWLFLPLSSYFTINRHQPKLPSVEQIYNHDYSIFKVFVEFIALHETLKTTTNPKELVSKFFADSKNVTLLRASFEKNHISSTPIFEQFNNLVDLEENYSLVKHTVHIINLMPDSAQNFQQINVAFLEGTETGPVKAQLASIGFDIVFLLKNNGTQPANQNLTLAVLNYNEETLKVHKDLNEYISCFWDEFNWQNFNEGILHFQGGYIGGTRNEGTGTFNYLDNQILLNLFTTAVNNLISEGADFNLITVKQILHRTWFDQHGNINNNAVSQISQIFDNNARASKKLQATSQVISN
ncbi:MAG: hypothetical protein WCK98_02695 [bacterium]